MTIHMEIIYYENLNLTKGMLKQVFEVNISTNDSLLC